MLNKTLEQLSTFYLVDENNSKRVATIVYSIDEDTQKVSYGYSIFRPSEKSFHSKEQFKKKIYRAIAAARLVLNPIELEPNKSCTPRMLIVESFNRIVPLHCDNFVYRGKNDD